ncbi:hypothetical protein DM02DRAFT_632619 [Periconia macrospinosa]|uniref:Uncharacterized protein n=1 Tax=Periconia macrospinosa TaxID=97972 RepID=A0A2V1DCF1_9PLEO|nr:hypothetical protein DM02DRAFT_632619 [Periconia macrospinosa]
MASDSESSQVNYERLNARVRHTARYSSPESGPNRTADADFMEVGGQFGGTRRESYPHSLELSESEQNDPQPDLHADFQPPMTALPGGGSRSSPRSSSPLSPQTPIQTQFGPYIHSSEYPLRRNRRRGRRRLEQSNHDVVQETKLSPHKTGSSRSLLFGWGSHEVLNFDTTVRGVDTLPIHPFPVSQYTQAHLLTTMLADQRSHASGDESTEGNSRSDVTIGYSPTRQRNGEVNRSTTPTPAFSPSRTPSHHSRETDEDRESVVEPQSPHPFSAYNPYNPDRGRTALDGFDERFSSQE